MTSILIYSILIYSIYSIYYIQEIELNWIYLKSNFIAVYFIGHNPGFSNQLPLNTNGNLLLLPKNEQSFIISLDVNHSYIHWVL